MLLRSRADRTLTGVCLVWLVLANSAVAQDAGAAGTPPQPLPPDAAATAQPIADPLLDQVDEAIRMNAQRFLTANYHSPWQIFHGILAYHQGFQVKLGDQQISAIEWIATAQPRFDNQPLLLLSQHGAKFHPYTRPYAFEGHPGQSLALLSESHLPVDYQLMVEGKPMTLGAVLQNTMMEVNSREETTWVLWALINYFKVDAQWTNQWGQPWSMEALVQNEVNAHTPTRPCGGNHNLYVLSRARDKYLATGRPLRGVWFEADQKIRQYIELARSMQNPDGSFSSNFYKGPGFENDMNKRFNTTGHTMEFLSVGLPDNRLNEPWVRNAVNVLSRELIQHRKAPVDCGPLYHSLNALRIYRDRVRPPMQVAAVVPATPATAEKPEMKTAATTPATPVVADTVPATPATASPVPVVAKVVTPPPTPAATPLPTPMPTPATGTPSSAVDVTAPMLPVVSPAGGESQPASALKPVNVIR